MGEKDFRDRKGRLQEVEALGHRVLFYLKFHCELNLSNTTGAEQNGLQGKIVGTKATVPEALASVSNASIRGIYRLALRAIDAYSASARCGAEGFGDNVYKSFIGREKIGQIGEKSKW